MGTCLWAQAQVRDGHSNLDFKIRRLKNTEILLKRGDGICSSMGANPVICAIIWLWIIHSIIITGGEGF